jgi:hypothetical protein
MRASAPPSRPPARPRRRPGAGAPRGSRLALPAGLLVLALAGAHIFYLRFVCDDAFISFRYAANLAHGHGLVYNPGEHVEGYSNFLWTLLAAAVIRLGGRPEQAMPMVSALFALLTLGLVMAWARRRRCGPLEAGVLLAANTGFAAWGTSGLETALFGALITAGCLAVASALEPARLPAPRAEITWPILGAFLLALASLTRPEGMLVSGCAGAFLLIEAFRRRLPWMSWCAWAAVWLAGVVPHLAWRHAYYGRWFPNSFTIKTPGLELVGAGAGYVAAAFLHLHLYLLAIPIVAGLLARKSGGLGARPSALLACVTLPFLLYVCTTGGDFMPLYRFVVPLLPLIALAAGATLAGVTSHPRGRGAPAPGRAWALVLLVPYVLLNTLASRNEQEPWDRGYVASVGTARLQVEDWGRIGRLLADVCLPTDTLATTAAGIIPYRAGLYTIDLLGLNAPDLDHFRRRESDRPGHRILLSEDQLHRRRPQILLGHPMVRPTQQHLGFSLDLEPGWRERILAGYSLVGFTLHGTPTRFVGCMVRNDVLPRVLQASDRRPLPAP